MGETYVYNVKRGLYSAVDRKRLKKNPTRVLDYNRALIAVRQ